jgi:hypothetical protein
MKPLKILKEKNIMVKFKLCTLFHPQENNLKKYCQKFLRMINTLKLQLKLPNKDKIKIIHTK